MTGADVDPAAQATFEALMNHGRQIGVMMADTILAASPPPWDEAWFERFYSNAIEQAGEAFKIKWPELSETIIANMQVRFCEGLEGRFRSVLGGGQFLPGGGKGVAN